MGLQLVELRADWELTAPVRALLTPALAVVNPKAYIAHFRRLDDEGQRHYLGTLTPAELKTHFKTIGEHATVGLLLSVEPRLEATVGGAVLGAARGPDCVALQARALTLGRDLEAKAVSGLVSGGSLSRLAELEASLAMVGWVPKTVVLAGDSGGGECAPALGWSIRGGIRVPSASPGATDAGSFYMPSESLVWGEREQVEALLRDFAARWGAVLDVRL